MRLLEVLSPGPRTTIEDLGRRGVARWGLPAGGAFDACALIAANRLLGNRDDDAGLELTLAGPSLRNAGDEPLAIALSGADGDARLVHGAASAPVPVGVAVTLAPADVLRVGRFRDGAREWLAIAGGIAVPRVAGSRSTALGARLGGLEGRVLGRGDALPVGVPQRPVPPSAATPWLERRPPAACMPLLLRVLPGPQAEQFGDSGLRALTSTVWRVQSDSDRTGVRLAPAADDAPDAAPCAVPGIPPEGTTLGAIQVPPDGRPIVLGPDRPVTGGYAKPLLVAAVDLGRLAQLRPGDTLRLAPITLDEALALAAARRAALPPRSS
jgi:biotin-dependent carboxylase-like uncharacterized protein